MAAEPGRVSVHDVVHAIVERTFHGTGEAAHRAVAFEQPDRRRHRDRGAGE